MKQIRTLNQALLAVALLILAAASPAAAQDTPGLPDYELLLARSVSKAQSDRGLDEARLAFDAITDGGRVTNPLKIAEALRAAFPRVDPSAPVLLPPEIRANVIDSGRKYDRLVAATARLLNAAGLRGKVRPILFDSAVPSSGFSYPNAVFFSTRALSTLSDDDIEAISAQAVAHLLGRELFKAAVDQNDDRALRVIELFCDAAAASMLASMGRDSGNVVSAIRTQLRTYEASYGNAGPPARYPDIKQRAKLSDMLSKKFRSQPVA